MTLKSVCTAKTLPSKSEFCYGVYPPLFREVLGTGDVCSIALSLDEANTILEKLTFGMMGATRSIIAPVDLLLQGIGYLPPVKLVKEDDKWRVKIGVYVRNKTNNEGQLSQKLSIGLGGHIEPEDVHVFTLDDKLTGSLDLLGMLQYSSAREAREEAFFGNECKLMIHASPVGFVKDGADHPEPGYVGNHHFGAIYPIQVFGDTEFTMSEKNNDAIGWFDAADLRLAEVSTGASFEPWSQMILKEILQLSIDPQEISDKLVAAWGLDTGLAEGWGTPVTGLTEVKQVEEVTHSAALLTKVGGGSATEERSGTYWSPIFDAAANVGFYTPQVNEPSPFGPKTENYIPNPWIQWHEEGGLSQHEVAGVTYGGGPVIFLEEVIKSLQYEEMRTPEQTGVCPPLKTDKGHLSLAWLIWFHYNVALSWEETHAVGMARIAAGE